MKCINYCLLLIAFLFLGGIPAFSQENIGSLIEAAEQGDAEAQFNLGYCYYDGDVVAQDYAAHGAPAGCRFPPP